MREIKFRGKKENTKEWVYGSLVLNKGLMSLIIPSVEDCDVNHPTKNEGVWVYNETVGQFTGMKDKDNNEIYEGDYFVKVVSYIGTKETGTFTQKENCVVNFHEGKFMVRQEGWAYFDLMDVINQKKYKSDYWESGKVVGNIHDNPQLIE